jgi:hypothetical protein
MRSFMNKDMEYMYNWINDDGGWREEWDPIDLNIKEWLEDPDFFKEKETSNSIVQVLVIVMNGMRVLIKSLSQQGINCIRY